MKKIQPNNYVDIIVIVMAVFLFVMLLAACGNQPPQLKKDKNPELTSDKIVVAPDAFFLYCRRNKGALGCPAQ